MNGAGLDRVYLGGTYVRDNGEARRERTDPLPPARHEQKHENRHQIRVPRHLALHRQARGPVPEGPVQGAGDDGGGDLGDDVGGAEGDPAVDAGGVLARLPERHVAEELGQHGVDDGRRDRDDQEAREHAVLQVLHRVPQLPEREPVEDADDDRREQLPVEIRRVPPVLPEHALRQLARLRPRRRRVLRICILRRRRCGSGAPRSLQPVDFLDDSRGLFRVPPFFIPVDLGAVVVAPVRARRRLEDKLGDVLARRRTRAARREVLDHVLAVLPDGPEVERVPARVERQHHVELLDQHRARWWIVQMIACPARASFLRKVTIEKADCESRPDVGSSRKSRREASPPALRRWSAVCGARLRGTR